jgi:hypothetical protein
MSGVPSCFDDRAEARRYAAERLRRYRRRFPVTTLERGAKWEILEPDDAVLVPDACGTLNLEHVTWECRECGFAHDSQHDALHCCAEYGRDEG